MARKITKRHVPVRIQWEDLMPFREILSREQYRDEMERIALECFEKFYSRHVSMFVSGLCHEIRSPTQAIRGSLEIINEIQSGRKTTLADSHEIVIECLKMIDLSHAMISRVVDSVLDFSKDSSHTHLKPINVRDFFSELIQHVGVLNEVKSLNVELKINIDDGVPEIVYTIPAFINQIITNMVCNSCNAIYAKGDQNEGKNEIKISVHYDRKTKNENINLLVMDVEDNGVGIDEEDADRIFEPFFSTHHVDKSSGLGLFVCKTMSHYIGGNIVVLETRKGKTVMRATCKDEQGIQK